MIKDKTMNIGIDSGKPKEWRAYVDAENKVIKRNINTINIVLVGIVIALFIAFLFLITDDYMYKVEMYRDYKNDVKTLNTKVDKLLIIIN